MEKFKTDGFIVTDGKGSMGIFSATEYLNDVIEENEKLKRCLSDIVEDIYIANSMNNKEVNPEWVSVNNAKKLLR